MKVIDIDKLNSVRVSDRYQHSKAVKCILDCLFKITRGDRSVNRYAGAIEGILCVEGFFPEDSEYYKPLDKEYKLIGIFYIKYKESHCDIMKRFAIEYLIQKGIFKNIDEILKDK